MAAFTTKMDAPADKPTFHPSIFHALAPLRTYSRIKKHLKRLGCTCGESREIVRAFKKEHKILDSRPK